MEDPIVFISQKYTHRKTGMKHTRNIHDPLGISQEEHLSIHYKAQEAFDNVSTLAIPKSKYAAYLEHINNK